MGRVQFAFSLHILEHGKLSRGTVIQSLQSIGVRQRLVTSHRCRGLHRFLFLGLPHLSLWRRRTTLSKYAVRILRRSLVSNMKSCRGFALCRKGHCGIGGREEKGYGLAFLEY